MKEQNIISSLVDLTKQRDQIAIRAKLLGALIEITDAAWLVLCRLLPEDEEEGGDTLKILDRVPNPIRERSSEHYPNQLFEDPAPFHRCIDNGRPVWVEALEPYQAQIFWVPGHEAYDDFIVLFTDKVVGRDERIVNSILDLYENFLTLIIENTQDPLTRLLNRQTFDKDLTAVITTVHQGRRRRNDARQRCFFVLFDIDHFKRVNDTFGHLYGDEVLLLFSSLLQSTFRDDDRLYRYGGEEFAAILCGLNEKDAHNVLERMRKKVESYNFPQVGQVTVSIGYTELLPNTMPTTVIERSDQALYYSKDHGRNRVTCYEELAANEHPPEPEAQEQDIELF